MDTAATAPNCHARRYHARSIRMVAYGTTVVGVLRVDHYECPRCGRIRRVETPLYAQPTLFDATTQDRK